MKRQCKINTAAMTHTCTRLLNYTLRWARASSQCDYALTASAATGVTRTQPAYFARKVAVFRGDFFCQKCRISGKDRRRSSAHFWGMLSQTTHLH